MRLFGLGKPNPEKLKEAGDVQGLASALRDSDPSIKQKAFDALVDMTTDPRFRNVNEAALDTLRQHCLETTRSRFKAMLSEIPPIRQGWRDSAIIEGLAVIGSTDALESYFDRYAGGELADGLFMLSLSGFLVRHAAVRRDLRLLKKLLIAGPFGPPDALRLGASASDVPDLRFPTFSSQITAQSTLADVGGVFCELASEDDLLEVAVAGGGSSALPVIFERLAITGTTRALPTLEKIVSSTSLLNDDWIGRRRAIAEILRRASVDELIALAQGNSTEILKGPALKTLCERADPKAADVIVSAIDHHDDKVAAAAIAALPRLAAPDAVSRLSDLTRHRAATRRDAAVLALTQIPSSAAVSTLLQLPLPVLLQTLVIEAIARADSGGALVARLRADLDDLPDDQRPALMATLRRLIAGPELSALQNTLAEAHVAALDDANWGKQKRAAEALAKIGGERALQALERRAGKDNDLELQSVLDDAIQSARSTARIS